VLGQSDGVIETKIDFDTCVPVAGTEIDLDSLILKRTRFSIGIPVNGRYEKVQGKMTGRSYSSDSKTGESKGKWSFIGGEPDVA
jgi:hypothetical protein